MDKLINAALVVVSLGNGGEDGKDTTKILIRIRRPCREQCILFWKKDLESTFEVSKYHIRAFVENDLLSRIGLGVMRNREYRNSNGERDHCSQNYDL